MIERACGTCRHWKFQTDDELGICTLMPEWKTCPSNHWCAQYAPSMEDLNAPRER